ncbi:hypothetical protein CKO28_13315 [Rhodovibrio sodomensis]|uniref:Uncharacterized protein n=1 Tax=Rhodovibrio sodomensis TaxID=1088 RepID=A0ABS1DG98_9PROT|nr:heavy metal-binding domain-containing protein [Rhodovibrio sodomensis]MBK1669011.1 hypothetical protein [Rhodovibrio sodomensis]
MPEIEEGFVPITPRDTVVGYEIVEEFGLIQASGVTGRGVGKEFFANIWDKLGGNNRSWENSFEQVMNRAYDNASKKVLENTDGGNAIVNARFDFGSTQRDMPYCVLTGQAVRVEKRE